MKWRASGAVALMAVVMAGCTVVPPRGALELFGQGGEVCVPTPETGSLLQLGGYVIENVEEDIAISDLELLDATNLSLDGAYVLSLGESYNLVGFEHLETDWRNALPPRAIQLADDRGAALEIGERYNLVAVVQVHDSQKEASIAGVRLAYREAGADRMATVEELIDVSPGGTHCLDG